MSETSLANYCIDLLQSYQELTNKLDDFKASLLADIALPVWTEQLNYQISNPQCPRARAAILFGQIEYLAEQAPREILICPGAIAASPDTLKTAQQLNLAKQNFKQAMLALKAAKIPLTDPVLRDFFEAELSKRNSNAALALKKTGLARLHLKQCYRLVPILTAEPTSISWTWAHTRSIKKITTTEAQELLLKQNNDAGIQLQLQKLAQLPSGEALAIVQELAPHLRANIVYEQNGKKSRQMIKGAVPILYPATGTELPKLKLPKLKTDKDDARVTRSDLRIAPEAFLPAIRAHRYLA